MNPQVISQYLNELGATCSYKVHDETRGTVCLAPAVVEGLIDQAGDLLTEALNEAGATSLSDAEIAIWMFRNTSHGWWIDTETLSTTILALGLAQRDPDNGDPDNRSHHSTLETAADRLADAVMEEAKHPDELRMLLHAASFTIAKSVICDGPEPFFQAFGFEPDFRFANNETFQRVMDELIEASAAMYDTETENILLFPNHPSFDATKGALMLAAMTGDVQQDTDTDD